MKMCEKSIPGDWGNDEEDDRHIQHKSEQDVDKVTAAAKNQSINTLYGSLAPDECCS